MLAQYELRGVILPDLNDLNQMGGLIANPKNVAVSNSNFNDFLL